MKPHEWRRTVAGKYLRHIPRLKQFKGTWLHRWMGDKVLQAELWQPDRRNVAAGMAVGFFFSMLPMPFQMVPAVVIAYVTRINIPAAIVGVWLSNPVTMPFILFTQYKIGRFFLNSRPLEIGADPSTWVNLLTKAPAAILLGAVITGIIAAAVGYPLVLKCWDLGVRFIQRSGRLPSKCRPPIDYRAD